jgi:hypothetical protein
MKSMPMPRHCIYIGMSGRQKDIANIPKQGIFGMQAGFSMTLEFDQYSHQEGHQCKD